MEDTNMLTHFQIFQAKEFRHLLRAGSWNFPFANRWMRVPYDMSRLRLGDVIYCLQVL